MASPLKILLPALRLHTGVDSYTERLATLLRDGGHKADIVWYNRWFELAPFLLRQRTHVHYDVVHGNSWNSFAFNGWAPCVVTTVHHCVCDPKFSPYQSPVQNLYHHGLIKAYEARSMRTADAVVSVSRFTQQALARAYSLPAPVQVIPNWLDDERFSPAPPARPNSRFTLLYVGSLSRRKGADVLPTLMRRLGDGFCLRIAQGANARLAAKFPANTKFVSRLAVDALVAEYQRCDALLFPSRYEGFGYVAAEAMSCAKPVLGFRAGATEELVRDGEDGLLVPIDDVDALVQACQRLANDRPQALAMGDSARTRIVNDFSRARAQARYLALYEQLRS